MYIFNVLVGRGGAENNLSNKAEHLADRLSGILISLNAGKTLTVKSLALKYGVTERTIQKDINSRLINLPIDRNNQGQYFMSLAYLGKFNIEDLKLLAYATGLGGLYPEWNQKLINRLLQPSQKKAYLIIGHNYEELDDQTEDFNRVEHFIVAHQEIKFQYKEKVYLNSKPYRLINHNGIWYLAVVTSDNKLKSFHFKKMKCISRSEDVFKPDPLINKRINESETIWFDEKEVHKITLWISPKVAEFFKRRPIMPKQKIIDEKQDGSLIVETQTGSIQSIIPSILYWLPDVRVLEPLIIKSQIKNIISTYEA